MSSPRSPREPDPVYRISSAGRSLSDDIDTRTRRYLISMGIRTFCFIGGVIAFLVFKQPVVGWILIAGALVLPYIAVVVANAGKAPTKALPRTTLVDGSTGLTAGGNDAPPSGTSTDDGPSRGPGAGPTAGAGPA